MHNPYFTPPEPSRHMIVIRGYDSKTKTFISNNPGTKNGEAYEYEAQILFDAIRDYPTGYHEKIIAIEKNMMNTRTGKQFAKDRHTFMEKYLKKIIKSGKEKNNYFLYFKRTVWKNPNSPLFYIM